MKPVLDAGMPSELADAFSNRSWERVVQLAELWLSKYPEHAQAHYLAGLAHLERRRMPRALAHLHVAAKFVPRRSDIGAAYARALASAGLLEHSLTEADRVMSMGPDDTYTLDALGATYTLNNAHDRARAVLEHAAMAHPDDANLRYSLATTLTFCGDLAGAGEAFERCLELQPTMWRAHLALARLRRQTPQDNHVAGLEALLSEHADDAMAVEPLSYALAKEYEDLNRYEDSFRHLGTGKSLAKGRTNYSFAEDQVIFDALVRVAPVDMSPSPHGPGGPRPIFVFGMPRTGTTLVERIISSHSDVHSSGELHQFGMALKRLSESATPSMLDVDTIQRSQWIDFKKLGGDYLSSTRPVAGNQKYFIDKLPQNFLYAAYIAKALPQAPMICMRRHPMDTCLSIFRQSFGETSSFYRYTLDLLDIGRYYLLFDRLIAHWKHLFPGRIMDVQYEGLVASQEHYTRAMLKFCGLPWQDACLRFEENPAPVATLSAVQVRSSVYASSIGHWRHYRRQLAALRDLLCEGGLAIEPF